MFLLGVVKVAAGLTLLYIIAATYHLIQHEVIRPLLPGAKYSIFKRPVETMGRLARWIATHVFGFYYKRPLFVHEWAGLYELKESVEPIKSEIDRAANSILASLTGGRLEYRRILLEGSPGSGTRQIAQTVYRLLSSRRYNVFYFDSSAIPEQEVHSRFINNLCAWANAAEEMAIPGVEKPPDVSRLDELVNTRRIHYFLSHRENPNVSPVIIVLDAERFFEVGDDNVSRKSKDILESLIRDRHAVLLITRNDSDLQFREKFSSRYRALIRKLPKLTLRGQTKPWREYRGMESDQFGDHFRSTYPEIAVHQVFEQLPPVMKIEEFETLITLTRKSEPSQAHEILLEVLRSSQPLLSQAIFDEAVKVATRERNRTRPIQATELQSDRIKLLVSLTSLFDIPVPLTSITRLWTECKVGTDIEHAKVRELLPLSEPSILSALIDVGLIERLTRLDSLSRRPVYTIRPAFQSVAFNHLKTIPGFLETATKFAQSILSDLRTPGVTPMSRYISRGDFRATRGLSGYLRSASSGDELVFPLPSEICEMISAVQHGSVLPECKLKEYIWCEPSGKERIDLVAALLPTEFGAADRVCRVGVHIVSREGTGIAVQRALRPFVDRFLDAEGDAYRFGPGGYMELLVVLRDVDTLLAHPGIKEAMSRASATSLTQEMSNDLILAVEDEVRKDLRASVDEQTTVQLIHAPSWSIIQDWISRTTKEFPAGFDLEPTSGSVYGSANRYSLVAREPALQAIRESLKTQGYADEIDAITLECVYSYITLQVFFIVKALHLQQQYRAAVRSDKFSDPKLVALSFLGVAEERNLNLSSLRHGPYGSYIVDFNLPPAPFGVDHQREYATAVIRELQDGLKKEGLKMTFMTSLTPADKAEDVDLRPTGGKLRQFGGGPKLPVEKFEYVADPEIFHRYMRKHLFIPDSDAAILTLVHNHLAALNVQNYRILEIGCGTGALTEKMIESGLCNITTIEPDKMLSQFWLNRQDVQSRQGGSHQTISLEDFVSSTEDGAPKFDILISQGVHHHVPTQLLSDENTIEDGNYRLTFLKTCRNLLGPEGIYIISDEFLVDYTDESSRRKNLDQWYRRVISTALAEGYYELADLEQGFWLNDQQETVEFKESIEEFQRRLDQAGENAPFEIKSVTRFGLTQEYGGGFGVLVLRPRPSI